LLLDLHVPQLDGLELLATLREDETTRDQLVVVFTEDDNPKLIQEARRLEAAAYLLKARLLPRVLSQTIDEVLRNRNGVLVEAGQQAAERAS
jgi:DNA-binding NarL/FixJ family response regulator